MKKVLFLAAVLVAALVSTSCSKKCTCTEKNSGEKVSGKLDKEIAASCSELEEYMNIGSEYTGAEWKCK